jgi:MscS family membrane protein
MLTGLQSIIGINGVLLLILMGLAIAFWAVQRPQLAQLLTTSLTNIIEPNVLWNLRSSLTTTTQVWQWAVVLAIADVILLLVARLNQFPSATIPNVRLFLILLTLTAVLVLLNALTLASWFSQLGRYLTVSTVQDSYRKIVQPQLTLVRWVSVLAITEVAVVLADEDGRFVRLEFLISLSLAIATGWLASRLFNQYFNNYLLDATVKSGSKVSGELLILIRILANLGIVIIIAFLFAQTHQINLVGLLASLGIGGLAVAFAAQKTLEQLLGGIVIYLDRPFVVDDYIGLPDGTFGRVESIGLRSTRIRTSGKGTVTVVPNSALTQAFIENFTDAKKVISILHLNFYRAIPNDERALIRRVILDSTKDIFGIDSRSTDVSFREFDPAISSIKTQVQITFFILGTGAVSLELRRQLLDIANQTIAKRLQEFGIQFHCEEPTIYVDSPITI